MPLGSKGTEDGIILERGDDIAGILSDSRFVDIVTDL